MTVYEGVTGAATKTGSTCTKKKIAPTRTPAVTDAAPDTASSPNTTPATTASWSGTTCAHTRATTVAKPYLENTPRKRRQMKGIGLGEKSKTGQCVGGAPATIGCSRPCERDKDGTGAWVGAPVEDSRLNHQTEPRLEPQTSTGGDDTILTPFSFSPSCDSAVDLLPELFLAYCTIHDMAVRCKSPASDIHARPVPDPYNSDPVPLLTD